MVGGLTDHYEITKEELISLCPETVDKTRQLTLLIVTSRKVPRGFSAIIRGIEDLITDIAPDTKSKTKK